MEKAKNYDWLKTLGVLPKMIEQALALVGTKEAPGLEDDNEVILGWAKELGGGLDKAFPGDFVPWCGLFMAVVAKRAGKTPPVNPAWALNWAKFGQDGGQPDLGDVLVFIRKNKQGTKIGGHVGLYIAEDASCFHVLGGNQSDAVCFTRIPKSRVVAVRQPPYMQKPASAKPYHLAGHGATDDDEA